MFFNHKFLFPVFILIASMAGGFLSNFLYNLNVSAAPAVRDISANSIRLVDQSGVTRAGLIIENGAPVLFINDKKQKNRVALGVGKKGPLLAFRKSDGSVSLFLDSNYKGNPTIGLMKDSKQPRVMISYFQNQGPTLALFDENNVGKAIISVTRGDPSITLADRDKKPAIAIFNKKGRGSYLSIWNRNNDPSVSLGVQGDKPGLFMYQQPRTGLLFNMAGGRPALALMDHGSPIWSATGDVPPAPELPPMDDMMRELTR